MIEQSATDFADEMDWLSGHLTSGIGELLQSFVDPVAADVQQNFDQEQTAGGVPWVPRKDTLPHKLLHKSGTLEGAATGKGPHHVEQIQASDDGGNLTFGVSEDLPYAARQNYGDRKGDRDRLGRRMNIPAREYMAISDGTLDELTDLAADWQLNKFARN